MISSKNKSFLLDLARKSIMYFLDHNKKYQPDMADMPFELSEMSGVFITLHKRNGELRGCVGYVDPVKQIWEGVVENAVNAAFFDSRFRRLQEEEINDITIEISVLTSPEKLMYNDAKELLDKVDSSMGLIIRKGLHSATFLPQVWTEFEKKEDFLEELCIKADLRPEAWIHQKLDVYYYTVESFRE